MRGVLRPCLERDQDGRACQRYAVPNASRCEIHQAERVKNRARSPSSTVTWTARWKRVRASVISKRRQADGTWLCEICGGTITEKAKIDVDHRVPVSEGGAAFEESNLRVSHARCNRREGGLTAAAQRERRTEASRIGQAMRARPAK